MSQNSATFVSFENLTPEARELFKRFLRSEPTAPTYDEVVEELHLTGYLELVINGDILEGFKLTIDGLSSYLNKP